MTCIRLVIPFLVLVLVLPGCGGGSGSVTGKVTANGKPVTAASIVFKGPTGLTSQTQVQKDGTYKMENAPIGDVTITVANATEVADAGPALSPEEFAKKGAAGVPKMGTQVPPKYGDEKTSGLKTTIKSGSQTYDIDLK